MVAQEYKIEGNIGYFTLDNATNNGTTMRCIAMKLLELGIEFDPAKCRLHCFDHIVNLIAKAFLCGNDPETFEMEADSIHSNGHEEAELELWRKRGPLGKLCNVIVWIGPSPQRRDKFDDKLKQLYPATKAVALVHGSETRRGGDYDEHVRAIQHREALGECVSTAIRHNVNGERDLLPTALQYDELRLGDWLILTDIMQCLEPFRRWQLILQGHRSQGALYDVLPAMDELLLHMED
jgi:hypothetical protein